ncbi:MAG TPA: hypothetical protein VFM73_03520 [Xanthomonadaceae bacterium]|nr:hypothetical protein [Xanthomonadaceae bacterium]
MEYVFRTAGPVPDIDLIERELAALDPAALLDFDASGPAVRISTWATVRELLECLHAVGVAANADDLELQPSVCCGGCSFG